MECCNECHWFREFKDSSGGRCRRLPPAVCGDGEFRQAQVRRDDYCGEFRPKAERIRAMLLDTVRIFRNVLNDEKACKSYCDAIADEEGKCKD